MRVCKLKSCVRLRRLAWRICLAIGSIVPGQEVRASDADAAASAHTLFDPVPDDQMRVFCTDRPTKGTGPCTVDAGHFQIESDILNETYQDRDGLVTDTYVFTSPNLKLGITNNMDVELNLSPLVEVRTHDHRTGLTSDVSGFGDMFLRVKTSLIGNGAGAFSAAFDPFVKIPTAPLGIGNGVVEEGAVVPLQLTLSEIWSLSFVPEIDVLKNPADDGRHAAGVAAFGITRTFSPQISASAELWTDVDAARYGTVTQGSFDVAATWQPPGSVDLQFDVGANFGLNTNTPEAQLYMGVSHRF